MARKTIIAGNWKMNGSLTQNTTLLNDILSGSSNLNTNIIICPPSVYLNQTASIVSDKNIGIGAQNLNFNEQNSQNGAFTGEISGEMMKDCGADFVIVGHSERRSLYGETNEIVASKVKTALDCGLTPILCIGEELSDRESGATNEILTQQIQAVFAKIAISEFSNIIIAYEPVWAIGTGVTASPAQAQETQAFIRGLIATQNIDIAENISILYGGSMNPSNAKELLACGDIDGGLIGGASLKAADFLTICRSV